MGVTSSRARGQWPRWAATALAGLVVVGAALGTVGPASGSPSSGAAGQWRDPKTSTAQDARYLTDVAEADADLVSYVNQYGSVALRGMLADGSAFCAFLRRGGGIDNALVDVAVGARADEKSTHLPLNVHTFNTLEALALIDLCPGEQRLVPTSVRMELRHLGGALRSSPSP